MVKNPPANAGDTGLSPGKIPHAVEQLSLHTTTTEPASRACEPQLLSPCAAATEARVPRARAPQQEKPLQWETCAPQLEKTRAQQRRPNAAKNK